MKNKIKLLDSERWKKHPWAINGLVSNVGVDFLKKIANPKSTNFTDLLSGEIVHQDIVWKNIKEEGLQEPLLIVISYDHKTIRLESGNHRIKTAIKDGYTHLPIAILVIKDILLNEGNGTHYVDAKEIVNWNEIIKCPYPYQVDPKKILKIKEII